MSYEYKCKFDGRKCNSNQKWNNYKCWCECKNAKDHNVCGNDYNWNPVTCSCKTIEYLESSIDN